MQWRATKTEKNSSRRSRRSRRIVRLLLTAIAAGGLGFVSGYSWEQMSCELRMQADHAVPDVAQ